MAGLLGESSPASGCQGERHVLRTPNLRFQTPTGRDLQMMIAAASDPGAQRWLGWPAECITPERDRDRLLCLRAGEGGTVARRRDGGWYLVAIDWASGRLAGAVGCEPDGRDLGGWLAPRFRGRGLGRELFTAAALFAHQHLGVADVVAGTEVSNTACLGALRSAGFVPAAGPPDHRLPDGRVVQACWLRHDVSDPARCPGRSG